MFPLVAPAVEHDLHGFRAGKNRQPFQHRTG
jgi:hypothetical protein